jgi:preprotein translocase subunit Sec63
VLRKTAGWLLAIIILLVVFFLLRFGLTHLAAIVSFISVVTPLLQRLKNLQHQAHSEQMRQGKSSGMDVAEAREILGIGANASAREIRTAYRKMMQKNHPDQGGSAYLAGKINEARDILLQEKKQSGES